MSHRDCTDRVAAQRIKRQGKTESLIGLAENQLLGRVRVYIGVRSQEKCGESYEEEKDHIKH